MELTRHLRHQIHEQLRKDCGIHEDEPFEFSILSVQIMTRANPPMRFWVLRDGLAEVQAVDIGHIVRAVGS